MIWNLLIISLGLVAARENVEPEFLDELRSSGQNEKFAELLGIGMHLVGSDDSEQRSEGSKLNHASALGDILLTEEQERQAVDFSQYTRSRWPDGRIPYWISRKYNSDQRKVIEKAIADFNSQTKNLKLSPWKSGDKDYVFVFSGQGCYSRLGKTGGQQPLSLQANGCVTPGTVQHEFIHAAGLTHEHNRRDRDIHVKILWDNIPKTWHSQYQITDDNFRDIGEYDYYSVMHYAMWAPETFKDAFELPDGVDRNLLGQDEGVTPTDVEKLDILYS